MTRAHRGGGAVCACLASDGLDHYWEPEKMARRVQTAGVLSALPTHSAPRLSVGHPLPGM